MANKFVIPIAYKSDKSGLDKAENDLNAFGKAAAKVGGLIAGAFAIGAIVDFTKQSILGAEAAAKANARLEQIAVSMDVFGSATKDVTKRLSDYAEKNELIWAVDADVIKATQAKLLTFKNLAVTADKLGGAFDRATQAAVDMAAAGFGEAEQNAVQLGKALQDPIAGITALARSGITFTESEKEVIASLVETGKAGEAQNIILKAIETQVGGTATATASASDKMKLAFNQVGDAVGTGLLPIMQLLLDQLVPILDEYLPPVAQGISDMAKDILPALSALFPALNEGFKLFGAIFFGISQNDASPNARSFASAMQDVANAINATTQGIKDLTNWWNSLPKELRDILVVLNPNVFESGKALAERLTSSKIDWNKLYKGSQGESLLPIKAFATGGIVTKPTVGLVGEAGAEAIIPLKNAGGMLGTTVNIYGNVGYDAVELGREIARRQAQQFSLSGLNRLVGVA